MYLFVEYQYRDADNFKTSGGESLHNDTNLPVETLLPIFQKAVNSDAFAYEPIDSAVWPFNSLFPDPEGDSWNDDIDHTFMELTDVYLTNQKGDFPVNVSVFVDFLQKNGCDNNREEWQDELDVLFLNDSQKHDSAVTLKVTKEVAFRHAGFFFRAQYQAVPVDNVYLVEVFGSEDINTGNKLTQSNFTGTEQEAIDFALTLLADVPHSKLPL